MALFGKSLYPSTKKYKVRIDFGMTSMSKNNSEISLLDMAKEKFGEDKRLMMEIELFLSQRRKARQNPSRLAWGHQLQLLESYPKEERLQQVMRSIRNDYRSIAYERKEESRNEVKREKADENNIRFDLGF